MANKAQRILESVKINAGTEIYDNIINTYGILEEKASPNKQAKYIQDLLSDLENSCGSETVLKVMKPCGHQCISNTAIMKAKELYSKVESLEDLLKLLNENHIGGGKLHIKDRSIIGVYDSCYCGIAKQAKGLSACYCNCSAGWFEKLFSSVLEKDIEVKKLQTILGGSDQCIFEIVVGE